MARKSNSSRIPDAWDTDVASAAHSINLVLMDADRPLLLDEIMTRVHERGLPVTKAPREHLRRLEGKEERRPQKYIEKLPDGWIRCELVAEWLRRSSGAAPTSLVPTRLKDSEADAELDTETEDYQLSDEDCRRIVERQIRERRGRQQFRDAMCERYASRCVVTGCTVLAVLEAAHIRPYRGESDNHPDNGLLFRADIHTLFDLNLLGIEPKTWKVKIHPRITVGYHNLAESVLILPPGVVPSVVAATVRFEQFLLLLNSAS
jgi:hypothetical protein